MEEQLRKLVKDFETYYNTWVRKAEPPIEVTFFAGLKPAGYHAPQMMEYRNHPPYADKEPREVKMAYHNEIYINRVCIWRRSYISEDKAEQEKFVTKEMMDEIFRFGIMHSWDMIKNRN